MPLGKEVGLSPGHTVLDGDPVGPSAPTAASPHFSAHNYCGQTVTHLSNCWARLKGDSDKLKSVSSAGRLSHAAGLAMTMLLSP